MTQKEYIKRCKRQFYHSVCLILNIRKPEELETELASLVKTGKFTDGSYPYKGWTPCNQSAAISIWKTFYKKDKELRTMEEMEAI